MAFDAVHKIHSREFVTEPIKLQTFLEEVRDSYQKLKENADDMFQEFPSEEMEELEVACRLDLSTSEGDIEQVQRESVLNILARSYREIPLLTLNEKRIPNESKGNLYTLQYLERDVAKRKADTNHCIAVNSVLKYTSLAIDKPLYDPPKSPEMEELVSVHHDMMLTVRIHRPTYKQQQDRHLRWQFIKYDMQFAVLGRQLLTDLKDKIVCAMDSQVKKFQDPKLMEHFNGPTIVNDFPSSYFLIHDTFYNDLRHPGSYDLSKNIREWGKTAKGVGDMKTARMEGTRFQDLTLRLGQPYVYNHAGGCQHLVVFVMARLVDSNDPPFLSVYPALHQVSAKKPILCMICKLFVARWIVKNTCRTPYGTMLYCEECFETFNFDANKKKFENFVALPYVDRTEVL